MASSLAVSWVLLAACFTASFSAIAWSGGSDGCPLPLSGASAGRPVWVFPKGAGEALPMASGFGWPVGVPFGLSPGREVHARLQTSYSAAGSVAKVLCVTRQMCSSLGR
ncbi:hypothetical protein I4F81_012267 [Pyropia yezoensis]|uniref:Uncharacterized protein n=1 Tax=Pyropia yezoensis TaxID=2788 RepID=A0ACC3CJ93_PYRYE|nr:hypothetical protein I4F81_012267 [Neopyropia yezoensis]